MLEDLCASEYTKEQALLLQGLPTSWQKVNLKKHVSFFFLLEDFLNISSRPPGLSSNKPSSSISLTKQITQNL